MGRLAIVLRCAAVAALAFSPAAASAAENPSAAALAEGDAVWARRAEGARAGTALAGPVDAALASYRRALDASPGSLEARWRIMRALYFLGEHATAGAEDKKRVFDQGRALGDETLDLIRKEAGVAAGRPLPKATPVELVPFVRGRKDVTACFLWAAVDWGKWSLAFGKMQAVKQGAAAKIRDYATAVIELDPAFEDGGGYRVLGRLHHQTPSVPFLTGWASRGEALKNLRLAVQVAPRNFINRLYLAEAMWDYEKDRRPEARKMLEELVAETPSAAAPVEDARAQEDARLLLASWGKG